MNVSNVIHKLKMMLGSEFKFAEDSLVDGTVIYCEDGEFTPGGILYVKTDDSADQVFAPVGKHETISGKIITVGENGEIASIEDVAPIAEEVPAEEVALEEIQVETEVAPELVPATEELLAGIAAMIAPFTDEIATLKEEVVTLSKRLEKMAAEPAASKIKNTFAEVLADKRTNLENKFEHLVNLRNSK